ncbi:MAG: type IV pilus assembly protein PilV [Oleiphilaceae bacterium]|jgi:type IV pilus assembly protein PilV
MLDKQKGSSLIEVLVSLLVLTVGLLGVAGMQLISMKNANNAEHRYRASIIAYDMMERMRSNLPGVSANKYSAVNVSSGGSGNKKTSNCKSLCTTNKLATYDLDTWQQKISLLPSGTGKVIENATGFEITVAWNEQNTNRDQSPNNNALLANEYKLEFEL